MTLANKVVIGSVGRDVPSTWMLKVPRDSLLLLLLLLSLPYLLGRGIGRVKAYLASVCSTGGQTTSPPTAIVFSNFDFARFRLANRLLATMKVIRQRLVPYLLPHTLLHHALLLAIASRCRSYLLFPLPVDERLPQLSVHS